MFYVYVYRDPRPTKNNQPIYVGKGSGDRAWHHWRKRVVKNRVFGAILAKLRNMGLEPIIEIVEHFETPEAALAKEIELIALYGRRDLATGTLCNLTDGGDGVINFVPTDAFRVAVGKASAKIWRSPAYRAKMAIAQKAAQGTQKARDVKSKNSKVLWAVKGDKIAQSIAQARSQEVSRQKTKEQSKAMWQDPEYRAAQTLRNQEIANRGIVRQKKSEATKRAWADPTHRANRQAGIESTKAKLSKPVIGMFESDVQKWSSVTATEAALGINKASLVKALKSGQPIKKGKFVGWVFKYLDPSRT